MKKTLVFFVLVNTLLYSASVEDNETARKLRVEKNIQKALENERKFAKEQIFYTEDEYDFKDAEVSPESLPSIKEQKVDDLDMDSVYD
jgi:hypothetical protein